MIEAFQKADYFSLKDQYPADVSCQPSTITTFDFEGRQKRVENECAGPIELERLENKIDRIAELEELIGRIPPNYANQRIRK